MIARRTVDVVRAGYTASNKQQTVAASIKDASVRHGFP